MDRKKALLNIITAMFFKIIILILTLLSRRFLVNYLGNEANGLYSLFVSIIGFLAVADLGVGTAITFSMYKPIVENDTKKISALYYLYKKVYLIIAGIISVIGILVLPFISVLAKGNTGTYNIHFGYLLFLFSTILTYLYAYKTSFINAYKNNYITTTIRSIGQIIEAIVQIFTLIYFKSFELFFLSMVLSNIIQWLVTNIVFNKKYRSNIIDYKIIDDDLKYEVVSKTKAMFSHKIGSLLVNTLNGVIISAFIGVIVLGKYTNYLTILTGVSGLLSLGFVAITSILGHSYAKNSKEVFHSQFIKIYIINFMIGVLFYLGFLAIVDDLISIIFSTDVIMEREIVVILAVNYFIQFLRQTTLVFKDASGTFYHDRHKPIIEGIVNIILSLILVNIIGISGILIATIATNLLICHTIEPYVLFKYGFEKKPQRYFVLNYVLITSFVLSVYFYENINIPIYTNLYKNTLVHGFVSVGVSLVLILMDYLLIKPFRTQLNSLFVQGKKSVLSIIKRK